MTPSERIAGIRYVAARLADESSSIADLTLRQFGLPTTETWNGRALDYIVAMAEQATDGQLAALVEHCQPTSAPAHTAAPTRSTDGSFRLFISHVSSDKAFATALRDALRKYHVSGFVAHVDIEPTMEWQHEIEKVLFSTDGLVAIMTPTFHTSKWTDQEIGVAMGRGVPIIAVRAGLDPYGFIGKFQAVAGAGKRADAVASDLLAVLRMHDQTSARLAEAVVHSFEETSQWESARHDIGQLEQFQRLSVDHVDRIERACRSVPKIQESWHVPDRVERLVRRHREAIAQTVAAPERRRRGGE